MTHGSCMESPSGSGRAGIRIPDCSLRDRESRLALALESVSLAGSVGVGTTGDLIGITTESFTTTPPTYPTAESSSTVTTSITPAGFMAEPDFTAAALVSTALRHHSMDSLHRMPSPGLTLARSAASIMEEPPEAFPHEGSRASGEDSTAAEDSTGAAVVTVAVTGDLVPFLQRQVTTRRTKSCALRI